jgi:hypothetical protein
MFTLSLFLLVAAPALVFGQAAGEPAKKHVDVPNIMTTKDPSGGCNKDVAYFEDLLAQLDALHMPRERTRYKRLNGKLRSSMQRATTQAKARLKQAGLEGDTDGHVPGTNEYRSIPTGGTGAQTGETGDAGTAPSGTTAKRNKPGTRDGAVGEIRAVHDHGMHTEQHAPDARADRMSELVREARKLHRPACKGDPEAMQKNRALMDEFLGLMRAEARAANLYRYQREKHHGMPHDKAVDRDKWGRKHKDKMEDEDDDDDDEEENEKVKKKKGDN